MAKSDKAREIELWKTEGPLRQSARDKRAAKANRKSFVDVPLTDEKNYEEIMSKARLDLAPIEAPAMPLVKESIIELKSDMCFLRSVTRNRVNKHTNHKNHCNKTKALSRETVKESINVAIDETKGCLFDGAVGKWSTGIFRPETPKGHREHDEHCAPAGFVSEIFFGLVHTPIPMKQALNIPAAKAAVDAEWHKLEVTQQAWDKSTVMSKKDVIANAVKKGKKVYFGSLMDLCHEKHSELEKHLRKYKGRVVFRGDQVRDESGFFAVFSEQGTSASHQSGAKLLDAIARMPGCDGGDSDAVGAYTQCPLSDAEFLLDDSGDLETWISLPPTRRPKSWDNIDEPVCRLRLNLYGHPLAGLLWEKYCQKALFEEGFEKVKGWECMYKHVKDQLFLSVYVDDFKMAGNKTTLKPMWEKIGKRIKLEESVPLDGNVYLGCGQHNVKTDLKLLKEKEEFWKDLNTVRPHEVDPESDQNSTSGETSKASDSCPKKTGKRKAKAKAKAKAKPAEVKKSGSCGIIMPPLPSMLSASPTDKSHVKSYE